MAYEYLNCEALHVRDGDTVTIRFDLGFSVGVTQTVRLAHVDAPELHAADGQKARGAFAAMLAKSPLTVRTTKYVTDKYRDKTERYGRYLAEIFDRDGLNLGDEMVKAGLAKPYEGGKR